MLSFNQSFIGCLTVCFIFILFSVNAAGDAPEAIVTFLEGTVQITSGKTGASETYKSPLKESLTLYVGDIIEVKSDSNVEFRLSDDSIVLAAAGTTMTIEDSAVNANGEVEKSVFQLTIGRVWVYVVNSLKRLRPFSITTPTAIAGVRGTTFSLEVFDNGDTLLSVNTGVVELFSQNVVQQVTAGCQSMVRPGEPPMISSSISQSEKEQWNNKQWWIQRIRQQGEGDNPYSDNNPEANQKESGKGNVGEFASPKSDKERGPNSQSLEFGEGGKAYGN